MPFEALTCQSDYAVLLCTHERVKLSSRSCIDRFFGGGGGDGEGVFLGWGTKKASSDWWMMELALTFFSVQVKGGLFLTGGSIATLVNVRFIGLQADGDFTLAPFVVANQASAYLSSVNVEGCQFIGKRGTRGASAILLIGNSGLELHHSSIKSNKGTSAAIVVNGEPLLCIFAVSGIGTTELRGKQYKRGKRRRSF